MFATLRNWLRALAVVIGVVVASPTVEATGSTDRGGNPPAGRRETLWGLPRNDPAIAIGAIAAALALVVFVAWIASRVGDRS